MDKFFKLKENNTTVSREIISGITTFFAMAYAIIVTPNTLSATGMEWGAVFLAAIISSVIGTLIMGLAAGVPYAQAPGLGLSAFFVYTVCGQMGYEWQQALSMVFVCGLINIFITVTSIRQMIIKAIPLSLQNAIGGGIGIYIAYVGFTNVGLFDFSSGVPALSAFSTPQLWVFVIGLILTIILAVKDVRGGILIGIIITTLVGIPFGVTHTGDSVSFTEAVKALPTTFGAIFTSKGIPALFSDPASLPIVIVTVFSFSLSDTFDTIGTFIGTGKKTGIFTQEDIDSVGKGRGFSTKMEKALFADATATSIGAIFGTSNVTTFVESAAGIGAGGRTGLTSVVTAICFILSAFLASFASAIPYAATAPALVVVGCMMTSSFKDIDWENLSEAIPAFFAGIFMALCFSISYGIAMAFITYCIIMAINGRAREIKPILTVMTVLFIINFVLLATV